jgi:phage terminase Nu1 subunit (DNA packaging protein)
MATVAEAAEHLFLSERRFYELLDQSVVTRMPASQYDLDIVREQYVEHLRGVAAGRTSGEDGLDLTAERARLAKEQADAQEMKNARERADLLPRDDVHLSVTESFTRVRAKLLSLPSKLAPMVFSLATLAEVRDVITKAINEALAELSSTTVAGVSAPVDEEPSGS